MYLVGDSFRVSFIWVVIISTKQEAGHTGSMSDWGPPSFGLGKEGLHWAE